MFKKKLSKILIAILTVALLAVGGFAGWALTGPSASPMALAAMQSDDDIRVDNTTDVISFTPVMGVPPQGFIFYPGARVDPQAYAPLMHSIANMGVSVYVVKMPLRMAVLNPAAADAVIAAHPETQFWFIGGHSLGGVMAANYARTHPQIKGVAFWAAYPAGSDDLSSSDLKVVSISGSIDALATPAKIEASRPLLPPDTHWVVIEGGNHSQFGDYGLQSGDTPATISADEQHAKIVMATVGMILGINK